MERIDYPKMTLEGRVAFAPFFHNNRRSSTSRPFESIDLFGLNVVIIRPRPELGVTYQKLDHLKHKRLLRPKREG